MFPVSYEQSAITYVWKNDEDTLRKSPSLTTLNAYLIQNQTIPCPIKASWRGKRLFYTRSHLHQTEHRLLKHCTKRNSFILWSLLIRKSSRIVPESPFILFSSTSLCVAKRSMIIFIIEILINSFQLGLGFSKIFLYSFTLQVVNGVVACSVCMCELETWYRLARGMFVH